MTHSIQNTIPQVICLHSAQVITSALILPSPTVLPCFTSTYIFFDPSHFQVSKDRNFCVLAQTWKKDIAEKEEELTHKNNSDASQGWFETWNREYKIRVQQYFKSIFNFI